MSFSGKDVASRTLALLRRGEPLDLLGTLRGEPAPIERELVLVDVAPVQLEGAIERGARHRQQAALKREAEHQHVRADAVAEQRRRRAASHRASRRRRAAPRPRSAPSKPCPGNAKSRSRMKSDGISSCVLTMTAERSADSIDSGSLPAATIRSAPSRRSTCPAGMRMPCNRSAVAAMRTCDNTAPYFCARPGLIELLNRFAFEMRREAEQAARRHDAGAADAGDQHVVHAVERRLPRLGQARQRRRRERPRRVALRALQRHEARAKAVQAAEVLVARRLVDAPLAPEFRLERHHRQAVRLHVAVAAALADELVDHDAPVRRRHECRACVCDAAPPRRSGRRSAPTRRVTSRSSRCKRSSSRL